MIRPPVYALRRRQWVPRRLAETFAFFEDPRNLPRITPPWLGFRILTPEPYVMAENLMLDYRVRVLGVGTRWRSLISEYEPPYRFRDVQIAGVYRLWDHCHRFRAEGHGTVIEDEVLYTPPLGPLGALMNRLFIDRQLREIFDYRHRRIDELLRRRLARSHRRHDFRAHGAARIELGLEEELGEPRFRGASDVLTDLLEGADEQTVIPLLKLREAGTLLARRASL